MTEPIENKRPTPAESPAGTPQSFNRSLWIALFFVGMILLMLNVLPNPPYPMSRFSELEIYLKTYNYQVYGWPLPMVYEDQLAEAAKPLLKDIHFETIGSKKWKLAPIYAGINIGFSIFTFLITYFLFSWNRKGS